MAYLDKIEVYGNEYDIRDGGNYETIGTISSSSGTMVYTDTAGYRNLIITYNGGTLGTNTTTITLTLAGGKTCTMSLKGTASSGYWFGVFDCIGSNFYRTYFCSTSQTTTSAVSQSMNTNGCGITTANGNTCKTITVTGYQTGTITIYGTKA